MSTTTNTSNGRVFRARGTPDVRVTRSSGAARLEQGRIFAATVLCYLTRVLPQVGTELARWRLRAARIPDPDLRAAACSSLAKRGNIEGAALFATLAPAAERRPTVQALVAFQTAYNYLDALSERDSPDPVANGRQLHRALLAALHPGAGHGDYYAHNPQREDGGYLRELADACAYALVTLPSFGAVAPQARRAAARIVDFQALNLCTAQGGHVALRRWAGDVGPATDGLSWWETAAGAGSSLAVHALIAAAAQSALSPVQADAIDAAYFPCIGALHSLLDSLVDQREDRRRGQTSLLAYYRSEAEACSSLARLAARARTRVMRLPDSAAHEVILTAMCSYYLSAPQVKTPLGRMTTTALSAALGVPLRVAIATFRAKRLIHDLTDNAYV